MNEGTSAAAEQTTPVAQTSPPQPENNGLAAEVGHEDLVESSLGMAPISAVQVQLNAALAELDAMKEKALRAQAELLNAQRRAADDLAKAHKFAINSFAESLLAVADSLEAALADNSGDLATLKSGVTLTRQQLLSALEKHRVTVVNPVGEKFDPHQQQAISNVPATATVPAGHVVTVLQKGYLIADRVLRPALVTVAQNNAAP